MWRPAGHGGHLDGVARARNSAAYAHPELPTSARRAHHDRSWVGAYGIVVLMPYESARDLPIFVELEGQLRAIRLLRWLMPREQRENLEKLGPQLEQLTATVDDFYARLGDRHWVMHESLNVEHIRTLLDEHESAEGAELALVSLYQDRDTLHWMIKGLHGLPAMRSRLHLVERAERDYVKGRHYSTVLVLIAVMDGFVNDFEPRVRRGLHARTPAELDAWNSVVGHHKGLTHVLPVFQRSFKALHEDEVFEVYRHGIVHGMVMNFDNIIVATKAWNYLFAVADWARAEIKRRTPEPPTKTWRETFTLIAENARDRAALEAFTPHALAKDDPGFEVNEVYLACSEFLKLWARKNYGHMHAAMASLMREDDGRGPAKIREAFEAAALESFEILHLDFTAAAVCIVTVRLVVDDTAYERPLRWLRENEQNEVAAIGRPGSWRLMTWGADYILRDE